MSLLRRLAAYLFCEWAELHDWRVVLCPADGLEDDALVRQCLRCLEVEVFDHGWSRVTEN